ncbi:MAG: phage tail protein [Mesorhizobium sp.]
MVKAPNVRHSKTRRDPVTIELKAESADKSAETPRAQAPAATMAQPPKAEASPRPSGATPNVSPAPGPKIDETVQSSPAFGRDAGKTSAAPGSRPADANPAAAKPADAKPSSADAKPASPARPSPEPPRRGGPSVIAAGLIGGVVALAGAGGLQWAGMLPVPGSVGADTSALEAQISELKSQVAALPAPRDDGARIEALAAELQETKAQLASAANAAPSAEAAQALDERFKAIEAGLASAQGGAPVDLAPVNGRIDTVEAAAAAASQAAQSAQASASAAGERIGALERAVGELTGKVAEQAEQPKAALAIAASALKAAIDRGDPFTTEVDTLAAITEPSPELDTLRSLASDGVASREGIVSAFPAAANAMIAASQPTDPNAGIVDRLIASAQSLVQVRPVGMVEGGGVAEAVARMEVLLSKGDYGAAIAEYDRLADPAKAAGASFIALVKARVDADKAMDTIFANALKA